MADREADEEGMSFTCMMLVANVIGIICLLFVFKSKVIAMVFSVLCKRVHAKMAKEKDALFKKFSNQANEKLNILELGAGSGMNFKYYPEGSKVTCLDPNSYQEKYLRGNFKKLNPKIELKDYVCGVAEDLSCFKDGEFDAVVETLVLCSVKCMSTTLNEVKRVLKPGGKFYFIDHVADHHKSWHRWFQDKITTVAKATGAHCGANREIAKVIEQAGFSSVEVTKFELKMPLFPVIKSCVYGTATK